MILGLDISTSNVGFCILGTEGDLVDARAVSFSKNKTIFEKALDVRAELQNLKANHGISKVLIEENLQAFRPGFSSAKTIVTLARFNGIVTFLCSEVFEIEPEFMNVNSARKKVGLKIDRKSTSSTKDQVLGFVKKELPGFEWPERTLKSGSRKGLVIPADCCYDIADAYIIAAAGLGHE